MSQSNVSLLQTVNEIPRLIKAYNQLNSGSLIEQSQPARVEPIAIVDESVRQVPWLESVLSVLTNQIAAYYNLAVSLQGTVGDIEVVKVLDKLNPSRSIMAGIEEFEETTSSIESYKYQLPTPFQPVMKVGVEDASSNTDLFKEAPNLALGKLIEVTVESNGQKRRIPTMVRLIASTCSPSTMVTMLDSFVKGKSISHRWAGVSSGRLRFIRDFILCQDLISEYRKARMKDTDDVFGAIIARRNTNRIASVLSGNISLATASNIIVMSAKTAKELQARTGLRLEDFRSREKYFVNTYTMIMVVVDDYNSIATFYHRSIQAASEYSSHELESISKKGGGDISAMLQAYKLGSNPSLL